MAGKKRERFQNPKPFLSADDSTVVSNKRSKASKLHQEHQKTISVNISSKILREALIQQREIEEEENKVINPDNLGFSNVLDEPVEEEELIDEFHGYDDSRSHEDYEDKINEEDEKLLDAFLSKGAGQQCSVADVIAARIRDQDATVSSEARTEPKLDNDIIELYKGVGKALSAYTSGKVPKALKHIPALQFWEDILYLTEPDKGSANAMYQATRIFASNVCAKQAERFYRLVLLPRVREDVRKNKRLHFALYQSLIKSLYKPAAFNKGILFTLCEVTPEILRELDESRNRGEKENDLMLISSPISVINRTIVEDRFDIPYVPMEED